MAFKVGQKVVCVDARPRQVSRTILRHGEIYTIVALPMSPDGLQGVEVAEVKSIAPFGFWANRFRPVVERKTDISVFTKMLTPKKEGADA